ncbi:MAG: hypothetical protein IPM29_29745 [Planctomycetes bacterium]|nr:hypothetical protein [Planctomycetota bacterium]
MNKQQRAEMYSQFLREEGYAPKLDDDGDVTFKYEGGFYLILIDAEDEEFFRLVYPGFWAISDDAERARVERAALLASAQTKVVKIFPVRDDTWAAIEMFCSPPDVFKSVFRRSIGALRAGVQNFIKHMRE